MDEKLTVIDHPLIEHKLAILRDRNTGVKAFHEAAGEIARHLCYEASRDLQLEDIEVETPIKKCKSPALSGKKLAVVPVMRAGLAMTEGVLSLIPGAKVGTIGVYRDAETKSPVEYYCKLPPDIGERDVFVLDPVVATGESTAAAVQFVKTYGAKRIRVLVIIAAREGLEKLRADHPDIEIICAAVDEGMTEDLYVIPGLGDFGDRAFGTK